MMFCLFVGFLNIHVEGLDCLRQILFFRTLFVLQHLFKIQKVSSDSGLLFSINSSVNDSTQNSPNIEAILVTCRTKS